VHWCYQCPLFVAACWHSPCCLSLCMPASWHSPCCHWLIAHFLLFKFSCCQLMLALPPVMQLWYCHQPRLAGCMIMLLILLAVDCFLNKNYIILSHVAVAITIHCTTTVVATASRHCCCQSCIVVLVFAACQCVSHHWCCPCLWQYWLVLHLLGIADNVALTIAISHTTRCCNCHFLGVLVGPNKVMSFLGSLNRFQL